MLWIGTALMSAAGIIGLMVVILAKHPDDAEDLGSVSQHWIAENRLDSQ
ncbi:MAG TPA: hypothetical protein VNE16_01780 [Vicinamibacterales bacterium]|nr:hypothetical protein [Vicinamibacterales bacterium]